MPGAFDNRPLDSKTPDTLAKAAGPDIYAERPLPQAVFEAVKLNAIFDCFKWDVQVGDVSILANYPLILRQRTWQTLATLAEQLAAETLQAEQELLHKPQLHSTLGLPGAITKLWKSGKSPCPTDQIVQARNVRIIRFDFHLTTDGWRISEANSDVPGGYNEASGFTRLMAEHYPDTHMAGDPALALAQAVSQRVQPGATIGMIHATAYTDDRQVMLYLAKYLEQMNLKTVLLAPDQVVWQANRQARELDFFVRFFPAEWMPNLGRTTSWQHFFAPDSTPACNPTVALLTQSKRFPLMWDSLDTPLPTWRKLLPETRDPRTVAEKDADGWVYKPVLGRVGEDIAIRGITNKTEWDKIKRQARRHPLNWIAQRRFEVLPVQTEDGPIYPCLGVYTVNEQAAGIYARIGANPLIAATAKDIAVLVEKSDS